MLQPRWPTVKFKMAIGYYWNEETEMTFYLITSPGFYNFPPVSSWGNIFPGEKDVGCPVRHTGQYRPGGDKTF